MSSTHGHNGVEPLRRSAMSSSHQKEQQRKTALSGQTVRPTSSVVRPSPRGTSSTTNTSKRAPVIGPSSGLNRSDNVRRTIPKSAPIRSQSATKQKYHQDVSEATTSLAVDQRRHAFEPISSIGQPHESPGQMESSLTVYPEENSAVDIDHAAEEIDLLEKIVDFSIPNQNDAEQFEALAFLGELRTLSECLQFVLRRQLVDDLEADKLDKMVLTVTTTLDNFKTYSDCVQKLLETIRDQMKSVADLVFKMILQPALNGRGPDSAEHSRRNKALNVAEAELASRQHRLNSQLARANENLQRASVVALEADRACTQASIVAEQATEQARLAQAQYEERCLIEQETKRKTEERKALADQLAAEAERKRQQQRLEDEQRKADARRPPMSSTTTRTDVDDWPILRYDANTSRDYDGGLTCLIRTDPDYYQQDSFTCDVIDPVNSSFNSMFDEHEELLSNIVQLSRTDQFDVADVKKAVIVSLPYCTPHRPAMREPVVKCCTSPLSDVVATWQPLTTTEVAFDSHKAQKFVQVEVTSFPITLCVVLRPRKDYLYLSRRGDKITVSELDKNITFTSSRLSKREHFTMQLQVIDQEVKTRLNTIKGLLAASSIFTMHWASAKFSDEVVMTAPVPANPVKLAKISAARAGKTGKAKPTAAEPDKTTVPALGPPKALQFHQKEKEIVEVNSNMPSVETDKESSNKSVAPRWYMGEYDSSKDDDEDILYLIKRTPTGRWITDEQVTFTQLKIDLVEFKVASQLTRFIILRTRTTVSSKMAETMAENVAEILRKRSVCSVVRQRIDNPSYAVHLIVPFHRLDRTVKRLHSQGYEVGPEPSKEFLLCEGQQLSLSFHNNLCFQAGVPSLPVFFFNNIDIDQHFVMKEVDRFLQKQFSSYRGVVQLSRVSRVSDKKETGKQNEDNSKSGDDNRIEIVASHQITIPKDDECTTSNGYPLTSNQRTHATRSSVFVDPPQDFPAGRDINVLKFLAGELGDEWLMLSHCLQVRATRIQNIRRRADLEGLDDSQMRLEMLASWFKTQPRSVDKISILCGALRRSGRDDLAFRLNEWKTSSNRSQ